MLVKRSVEAQKHHGLDSKRVDLRSLNAKGASMARMISFGRCSGTGVAVRPKALVAKLGFDELFTSFLRFDIRGESLTGDI